jgi:hypothetical protein
MIHGLELGSVALGRMKSGSPFRGSHATSAAPKTY